MTDTVNTDTTLTTIPEDGPSVTLQQSSPEENNVEFVNMSKARFRRRLLDRWNCQIPGHACCFLTKIDGAHLALSDEAIERWVSALHDGKATLLIPPKGEFPSSVLRESDEVSLTSSSTIPYQRPFRWQRNPSLTDIRSMRVKLRNSITSSSLSTSTGLSGVPGVGYISGKAINWVGLQILAALSALFLFRRRRVISGLVKQLEKIPENDRTKWIFKKERKVNRALEDLLELTMEEYKAHHRTKAIKQGTLLRSFLIGSFRKSFTKEDECLNLMFIKLFPLYLLSNDSFSSEDFAGALKETLLQDSSEHVDEGLIAEITTQICFELAYGPPSPWRTVGYAVLCNMCGTAHGIQCLQDLGRRGPLIGDLATTAFANASQLNNSEHARAVFFFARYGDDVPEYRMDLQSSTGIPLFVKNLESLHAEIGGTDRTRQDAWRLCYILEEISAFGWCGFMLLQCDICCTLVGLLIFTQRELDKNTSLAAHRLVFTLRNLTVCVKDGGRQAVLDATTDDLRQILPYVGAGVRRFWGDELAVETENHIAETWQ